MHEDVAKTLIEKTFDQSYDRGRFKVFARNLVSGYDERHKSGQIPDSFKDHIQSLYRFGKIVDTDTNEIDIVEVRLKRAGSVHRARTMQRNFIARYLKRRNKDAALVAFVAPEDVSWRFSLVTQEHKLFEDLKGRIRITALLTPAKRLSFRVGAGEKTHTAKRQFLPILMDDNRPSLGILRNAFSVESVSKEFFEKYRELFHRTTEAVDAFLEGDAGITQHFAKREIETADFAKRLLGQIVFLYFLQKKGWLGVPADGKWGEGDRDFMRTLFDQAREKGENFFDQYLEPLFYEALAVDNSPEDHFYDRFGCRLPFLNGGLFEPYNDYQWQRTTILIDNALFSNSYTTPEGDAGDGILDIFDRYNFTVAEDEPLEKEVAVDPEMLGKVFENLLEVKDRRQSGTYYTPREIVHYMCQESLIVYLARRVPAVPKDDLETFIRYGDLFLETDAEVQDRKAGRKGEKGSNSRIYGDYLLPDAVRDAAVELDEALATVRICDPAIGSGAFPVGMMTEIVRARVALGQYLGNEIPIYNLKHQTIHESLYGVDINPGAIEIAKLRLWLSLVVDEEAYEQVQPLPNLDYRIMQGDSLLETYDGIKLFDDSIFSSQLDAQDKETVKSRLQIRKKELEEELTALAKLPLNAKHQSRRKEIEAEARKTVKALKQLETASEDGLPDMPLLNPLSEAARMEHRLRGLHEEYFFATDRSRKIALRKEIDDVEWGLIDASLKENGKADQLEDVEGYRQTKTRPFFLWRLHFSEVFHPELDDSGERPPMGGFDIVILNPPYISALEFSRTYGKEIRTRLKEFYESATGAYDYFVLFFERGVTLCTKKGHLCLITPNKYLAAKYAVGLRNWLLKNATLKKLLDVSPVRVFSEAAVYPVVSLLSRGASDDQNVHVTLPGTRKMEAFAIENFKDFSIPSSLLRLLPENIWGFLLSKNAWRLPKILKRTKPLSEFGEVNASSTAAEADEYGAFITSTQSSNGMKIINTGTIDRYVSLWGNANLTHGGEQFLKPYLPLSAAGVNDRRKEMYMAPKIIYAKMVKTCEACIDLDGDYASINTNFFYNCNSSRDLKYIGGVCNSRAFMFIYNLFFGALRMSGGYYQFQAPQLRVIPIPKADEKGKKVIAGLVERILKAKKRNLSADTSKLEHAVDQLVYQLYGFKDDEIAMIESTLAGEIVEGVEAER